MTQKQSNQKLNVVNDIIEKGIDHNILHLRTEDYEYNGRTIVINGRELINFGSCSYLGLEKDERVKNGAIDAIKRYGIQFSSSRSYVSNTLYAEWESLLEKMFDAHVITTTSMSLGHHSIIPVVVAPNDLIIQDQQVHASVQDAVIKMKALGTQIEILRHNHIDGLEKKILENKNKYNRIWYMIDGVYSMYGDFAPMTKLVDLLNKYPNFYLYADDAHGMSIAGKNGTGVVLSQVNFHPKMVLATSLSKGFGCGGGAFLFKDKDLHQKVKNCGGSLIFSGGHQIPVIGAGIASAKIHLTNEIYDRQNKLRERIHYCHYLLREVYHLPVVSNSHSPIVFIGLGLVRVGYNLVQRIIHEGCFVNLGVFPAVPEKCTGLRFTITLHHTLQDIEKICALFAHHFPLALEEEGRSIHDILRAFKQVPGFIREKIENTPITVSEVENFHIMHKKSISEIDEALWNSLLATQISMNWAAISLLERVFSSHQSKENHWDFHYILVNDSQGTPLAATFFIIALVKDDLFLPTEVSLQIEEIRKKDPHYLCSKTLVLGSLLTEGNHLYLNRTGPHWKLALSKLLDHLWKIQEKEGANGMWLRDFHSKDHELVDFFMEQGFLKISLPNTHVIEDLQKRPFENYFLTIHSKRRKYLSNGIFKHLDKFSTRIINEFSETELNHWYGLYSQVKNASLELNSFALPKSLFVEMLQDSNFEVTELALKVPNGNKKVVGITFCHKNNLHYNALLLGMDYTYLKSHDVYKQILYRTRLRAEEIGCEKLFLGFTAATVKEKLGATGFPQVSMIQMNDHYNQAVLNLFGPS
ncbi:MAG: aminotransferase class I/II-fold pyridoxal phosphate-dependent enzyme [Flavobacteriaceae bacterium]